LEKQQGKSHETKLLLVREISLSEKRTLDWTTVWVGVYLIEMSNMVTS